MFPIDGKLCLTYKLIKLPWALISSTTGQGVFTVTSLDLERLPVLSTPQSVNLEIEWITQPVVSYKEPTGLSPSIMTLGIWE